METAETIVTETAQPSGAKLLWNASEREKAERVLLLLQHQSNVYSPKFWPRAFAVWGHMLAANLLVGCAFFAVALLLAILNGLAGVR